MSTIEKYIQAMKVEQPREYANLLKGYGSEEALMKALFPLVQKAVQFHREELANHE